MITLSLVNQNTIEKDPTKLLYLYPSMPKIRLAKLLDNYYRAVTIKAAEDSAKANYSLLLPASCINYKRRDQSKRVVLFGKSYYVMSLDDMTEVEKAKYQAVCEIQSEMIAI